MTHHRRQHALEEDLQDKHLDDKEDQHDLNHHQTEQHHPQQLGQHIVID
jgi:hypothetical protein